jgi:hypothetical protein
MTQLLHPSDRQLLRAGGIAAIVLVAGYFATFPLYAVVGGPPPSGSEARLAHYAAHLPGWWGILGLMVFTDFLYLIAWYALHQVLKSTDRNLSLLSLVCAVLFVGLDLAVTWPNHAAMFVLGESYAVAEAADKAAVVAAAGFPAALLDSPLPGVYAIIIPSIGPFLAGVVMWRSNLSRSGAILAFLIGLTGVPSVAGPYVSKSLDLLHVPNALLVMAWFAVVGVRLLQLARAQTAPRVPSTP